MERVPAIRLSAAYRGPSIKNARLARYLVYVEEVSNMITRKTKGKGRGGREARSTLKPSWEGADPRGGTLGLREADQRSLAEFASLLGVSSRTIATSAGPASGQS